MNKADRALGSATLLLSAGDADGACNRAYYAMFDRARAALLVVAAPIETEMAKTHRGLIGAFGFFLVQPGTLDAELGRSLNRMQSFALSPITVVTWLNQGRRPKPSGSGNFRRGDTGCRFRHPNR